MGVNKAKQRFLGMMIQRHIVDNLMNGTCGLSDDELMMMASSFCHIEQNIDETCRILDNCDPKTLKRWEEDASLGFPKHHKNSGGKIFYWLDEIELWKDNHPDIIARVEQKKKNKN